MNPLKRIHFAVEPPKRQRIEKTSSLSGRSISTVTAELAIEQKLTGVFKVILSYGAIYEGELAKGLAHGKGRTSNRSGVVRHEGEYFKGQFHGYGAGDFHGYRYIGDYRNHKIDGYGAIYNEEGELEWDGYWVQGCKYVGEIKYGKPDGYGTTYNLRGNKIYAGEWKDGVPHGHGTNYLPGRKTPSFIGHFKNGMRDGYGVHYWEHIDEIRAEGTWKEGQWHGEMTHTSIDGTKTYHGFFENDVQIYSSDVVENERISGYFKVHYPNGEIYLGWMVQGLRHDKEHIFLSDGTPISNFSKLYAKNGICIYIGRFQNGVYDGYGIAYNEEGELEHDGYWVQGCRYVGEIKNGKPDGYGITYDLRGNKIYAGEWIDGVPLNS